MRTLDVAKLQTVEGRKQRRPSQGPGNPRPGQVLPPLPPRVAGKETEFELRDQSLDTPKM